MSSSLLFVFELFCAQIHTAPVMWKLFNHLYELSTLQPHFETMISSCHMMWYEWQRLWCIASWDIIFCLNIKEQFTDTRIQVGTLKMFYLFYKENGNHGQVVNMCNFLNVAYCWKVNSYRWFLKEFNRSNIIRRWQTSNQWCRLDIKVWG